MVATSAGTGPFTARSLSGPGNGRARQHGAALIISLVLLMVLTVLAVSTMRTASLGLLMAGNTQYRENAFQVAQTGLDAVMRAGQPPAAADCDGAAGWDPLVAVPELNGSYRTRVCLRGRTAFREGDSFGAFMNYEVTAEGRAQREARALLVQGFAVREAQ